MNHWFENVLSSLKAEEQGRLTMPMNVTTAAAAAVTAGSPVRAWWRVRVSGGFNGGAGGGLVESS